MAAFVNATQVSLKAQSSAQSSLNKIGQPTLGRLEQMSIGVRIASEQDSASANAMSVRFSAQALELANREQGLAATATASGALEQVQDRLTRISELTVQQSNTTNAEERSSKQAEIDSNTDEINRIAENTSVNGQRLFDGSFQGAGGQSLALPDLAERIGSKNGPLQGLESIKAAQEAVSSLQQKVGQVQSRFVSASANLPSTPTNPDSLGESQSLTADFQAMTDPSNSIRDSASSRVSEFLSKYQSLLTGRI